MRYFLCFCILFNSVNSFSQKSYKVTYIQDGESISSITFNGQKMRSKYRIWHTLVFNDSISFSFGSKNKHPEWKKYCKQGTSKVLHHSVFFRRSTKEVFDGVSYFDPYNPCFILDTLSEYPVHIDSTLKKIKEWRCREAYSVLSPGDTIFVLLAIDFPYPYTPLKRVCFPYLPIEIYHPKYDYHLMMEKIEEGNYEIVIPSGIPVFTRNEWDRKLKVEGE